MLFEGCCGLLKHGVLGAEARHCKHWKNVVCAVVDCETRMAARTATPELAACGGETASGENSNGLFHRAETC
jgi:hypothetical protein